MIRTAGVPVSHHCYNLQTATLHYMKMVNQQRMHTSVNIHINTTADYPLSRTTADDSLSTTD